MHRDGDVRPDTVGQPAARQPSAASPKRAKSSPGRASVTAGYYKLPEKTAELLEDGWLHSGDAGYIDENGHLVVIDRLSDVMHNRQGEMFSPMFLENKLKFSPYIKEAVIFGDQQDYVAALINIDPDRGRQMGRGPGDFLHHLHGPVPEARGGRPDPRARWRPSIARVEKPHFRIRRFAILYKLLDLDDGELTKTGKIRRKFVRRKYRRSL